MSSTATERAQSLLTSDFAYELPPERIARYPEDCRSDSRLLLLGAASGAVEHLRFRDLPRLMSPGDLLVVNDTRVFPARLLGKRASGAAAEVLLVRPRRNGVWNEWEALVRPGSKLKPGRVVKVVPELSVRILENGPSGIRIVRMESTVYKMSNKVSVLRLLERFGRVPLPPYLARQDEPLDRDRYQTVYGRREGSVAAPTAGLHFTPELLAAVKERGASCTL